MTIGHLRSCIAACLLLGGCSETSSPRSPPDFGPPPAVSVLAPAARPGAEMMAGARNGDVVFCSGDGIAKVDASGKLVWTAAVGFCPLEFPCTTAVDSAGNIYATSRSGLSKLSPQGALLWRNAEAHGAAVAVGRDRIYAASGIFQRPPPQLFFAVNRETGETIWRTPIPQVGARSILLDETSGSLYVPDRAGLFSLATESGAVKWSINKPHCGSYFKSALAADGTVYTPCLGDTFTGILAFRPDGSTRWEAILSFSRTSYSSPLVDAAGNIYITAGRDVISLGASGRRNWSYEGAEGSEIGYTEPVIDASGNVYIVDRASAAATTTIAAINNGFRREVTRVDPPHGLSLLLLRDGRAALNAQTFIYIFQTMGLGADAQWPMAAGDPGRQAAR